MLKMIKEACCDMNALSTLTLVFHRIPSKTVTYAHTKKKAYKHTHKYTLTCPVHTHLSHYDAVFPRSRPLSCFFMSSIYLHTITEILKFAGNTTETTNMATLNLLEIA